MTHMGTQRIAIAVASIVAGVSLGLLLTARGETVQSHAHANEKTGFEMDTWFDVSDPRLIVGESLFVVLGTVEETVRTDDDRTVFNVRVDETFKGETPESILVSQMGFVDEENRYELEGFPLMEQGHSYIMALAAPTVEEPQDVLTLLSGSGNGNKVEVTGVEDSQVAWFKSMIKKATSPHPRNSSTHEKDKQNADRWLAEHAGYDTPGYSDPAN